MIIVLVVALAGLVAGFGIMLVNALNNIDMLDKAVKVLQDEVSELKTKHNC